MGRYPRDVRNSKLKCISCNAPATETVTGEYLCVECGAVIVSSAEAAPSPMD